MAGVKLSTYELRTAVQVNNAYTIPILSNDSPKINYRIEFSALQDFILDGLSSSDLSDSSNIAYLDQPIVNTSTGNSSFAGDVGIGLTNPLIVGSETLSGKGVHVKSTTTATYVLEGYAPSYASQLLFFNSYQTANNRLIRMSNYADSIRLDSINDNLSDKVNIIAFQNNGGVSLGKTSTSYQLELSTDSAGKPTTNTWTITSDKRIKNDLGFAELDRCYDIVKSLPLRYYEWKYYDDKVAPDQKMLGWFAQDVQSVFPKAVAVKRFVTKPEIKELVSPAQEAIEPVYDIAGNLLNEPQEAKEAVYKVVSEEEAIEDCLDLNADQINKALYGAVQKLIEKVELLENEINILKNK